MTDVADKLRVARALIERGWTQGVFARNRDGHLVMHDARDATCFCVAGAIMRVTSGFSGFDRAAEVFARATRKPIHIWNDAPGRTQAEVLAAFDRAIELAEQSA